MKIVTFVLACMAWIKCTISPYTAISASYTRSVKNTLLNRSEFYLNNYQGRFLFHVRDGDQITIQKVVGGHFAPNDVVHGILRFTAKTGHERALGGPPIIDGQYGEVQVRVGQPTFFFQTALTRIDGYEEHDHDTRPVEYFCTIEREGIMFLAAVLKHPGEDLHWKTPRALFVNHLYRNPRDPSYIGELFTATPSNVQKLLSSL